MPNDYLASEPIALDQLDPAPDAPPLPNSLVKIKELLKEERPGKAQKLATRWIKKNAKSDFMDYALFYKGQGLFNARLYYQSFEVYEKLLNKHSASSLYSVTLQMQTEIAKRFLAGAKRKIWRFIPISAHAEGIEILERVSERWPGSELAGDALMIQADYYFGAGKFLEAQHTYQMLLDNYSQSRHYEKAMFQNAKATHRQYQGSHYDTMCLDEAIIRFKRFEQTFPQKAKTMKVHAILEEIEQQKIEKDFDIAAFYLKTGKTDAAIKYWTYICQQYPNTNWYQLAQSNIALYQQVK
ncbi:MAG: outer membrane protein assembly factor BamD [Phycisphaerae bacterium]|nr:outer membrane protein assembly factor BamD [Phycisphaerae bacterium]